MKAQQFGWFKDFLPQHEANITTFERLEFTVEKEPPCPLDTPQEGNLPNQQ